MAVVIDANHAKLASEEELSRMLSELEALTDEEAQRLFTEVSLANPKAGGRA
jgi:hypothetical protein